MNKSTVVLSAIFVTSALWGYAIGMLDYRLMINTAATCSCWIKFGALMAFTTFVVSSGVAFFLVQKTNLLKSENLDHKNEE